MVRALNDKAPVSQSAEQSSGESYYCPIMRAWLPCLPRPYPHRLFAFVWKRLTGWEDVYGRPAAFIGWRELFSRDF